MSGEVLSGAAEGILPGKVVASGDRLAVVYILDGMLKDALRKLNQELRVTEGGPTGEVGFDHFHLTLKVEGELVGKDES